MKTKTQRTAKKPSPARVHTQKKGQNKFDSGGAAVVLLFVPFLANQKQRSQAQLAVVVGKPACWWLLPRLTERAP